MRSICRRYSDENSPSRNADEGYLPNRWWIGLNKISILVPRERKSRARDFCPSRDGASCTGLARCFNPDTDFFDTIFGMAENPELLPADALVIMAHPDDPEFSAGGTIARWTRAGVQVTYTIVTDGSKGLDDRQITSAELVARRAAEQRAAAAHLGVQHVDFLGFPDSEVYNTEDLRRALVRQIRRHKPDLVITHDPTARLIGSTRINHPDHLAVGDTVLTRCSPSPATGPAFLNWNPLA